eukprot:1161591-Pelagomonas_calceolata.AAC.7
MECMGVMPEVVAPAEAWDCRRSCSWASACMHVAYPARGCVESLDRKIHDVDQRCKYDSHGQQYLSLGFLSNPFAHPSKRSGVKQEKGTPASCCPLANTSLVCCPVSQASCYHVSLQQGKGQPALSCPIAGQAPYHFVIKDTALPYHQCKRESDLHVAALLPRQALCCPGK